MKKKKLGKFRITMNINLKITLLIFSFLFFLIVIKLSYVVLSDQVDHINLTEFANNRNTTKEILHASRGSIYDVNGDELSKNIKSYTVIAYLSKSRTKKESDPKHVVDKERTAKELSPIINMSEESILNLLNQNLYQVELGPGGRGITEDKKKSIEALELPGISFISSLKRFYKNKSYASYLIGYARADENGEIHGEMGVEAYYDDILKGTDGYTEYQQDAYGYPMPNSQITKEAESGSDIYLTVDNNVQLILENVLAKLKNEHPLDWAQISVMDAKTGAIVGSATVPNFDLNTLNGITSYLNPLTSYQFEPGSTMKIFSFMSAIEQGIYKGDELFQSGNITLSDGTIINDFNNVGWGTINYDTGFSYSSNVAATKLALKLGVKRLKEFYENCGFGKKTGITLPNESEGVVNFTYESELANASFGQGMTVTPIQMLQALSALVNNGVMMKPYIISKIVNSNGEIVMQGEKTELNQIASVTTIERMKKMMYDVVYNGFSYNRGYAPDNVTIAGKTGTAQMASKSGGYLTGEYDYVKSFAGFFPYEEPRYVIYFSTQRLVSSTTDITKVISSAIGEIAKVMSIGDPLKDQDLTKIIAMNSYISKSVDETIADLQKLKLSPIVLGEGKYVIGQYPNKNMTVVEHAKIFLLTNGLEYKMPEVVGWSTNEIIRFCNMIGLPYQLNGYGKVMNTNIPAGSIIDLNGIMEINLG